MKSGTYFFLNGFLGYSILSDIKVEKDFSYLGIYMNGAGDTI